MFVLNIVVKPIHSTVTTCRIHGLQVNKLQNYFDLKQQFGVTASVLNLSEKQRPPVLTFYFMNTQLSPILLYMNINGKCKLKIIIITKYYAPQHWR